MTPSKALKEHRQQLMENLVTGYEQYKKAHPEEARQEEEFKRKKKEWPETVKKVIPKSKVKYTQSTVKMDGREHKLRHKLTLLATITGPEARALIESEETGEGHSFYYDTEKMDKVEIYREETLH